MSSLSDFGVATPFFDGQIQIKAMLKTQCITHDFGWFLHWLKRYRLRTACAREALETLLSAGQVQAQPLGLQIPQLALLLV
jgi:hypothetical protein